MSIGLNASSSFTASGTHRTLGAAEGEAFLKYLAVERDVAPATQLQAKAAPLFPHRKIPGEHLR